MKELLEYLASIQAGLISDTTELEPLLAACWDEFAGGEAEGMAEDKLYGRMENVVWEPPILHFRIERHGGTVLGSTRAEMHGWAVDVQERSAISGSAGQRQLRPMQPRLDVNPMAEEIIDSIVNHREDERLKWNKDGSVRILIGTVIPEGFTAKQTLEGRRRRFRRVVDEQLSNVGWKKVRANVYVPPATTKAKGQHYGQDR